MYCRKCGKQIDYDSEFCIECQEVDVLFEEEKETPAEENVAYTAETSVEEVAYTAETPVEEVAYTAPAPVAQNVTYAAPAPTVMQMPNVDRGSRMEGFGKALPSTILGFFAYLFSFISVMVTTEVDFDGSGVFLWLLGIGLAIPSLIMGIKSIKCFVAQKAAGKLLPIPTLILGIAGTVLSGLALFFSMILLLLLSMIASL